MKNYKEKIGYFMSRVLPGLTEAFKRGDQKFKGPEHFDNIQFMDRTNEMDVRHVRELHVDVRLREAEEAASNESIDNDTTDQVLAKIESAIGYLTILHYRVSQRRSE